MSLSLESLSLFVDFTLPLITSAKRQELFSQALPPYPIGCHLPYQDLSLSSPREISRSVEWVATTFLLAIIVSRFFLLLLCCSFSL